jgi:hypothetical protein
MLTRHPRRPTADAWTAARLQELWLGPNPSGSFFRSAREAREAWRRHRDFLMEQYGSRGRRPLAWWVFEASIEHPGYDRERSTLYEANMLAEAERAELEAHWREEFGRARALDGASVRRAHFERADIPPSLIEAWSDA